MDCYYRFSLLTCCLTVTSLPNVQLLNAELTGAVAVFLPCLRHSRPQYIS